MGLEWGRRSWAEPEVPFTSLTRDFSFFIREQHITLHPSVARSVNACGYGLCFVSYYYVSIGKC